MAPRVSVVLLVLLFVALPAASAVTSATPSAGQSAAPSELTQELSSDQLAYYVQLRPNGDARWTVTRTFPLDGANETSGFETLGERFENGETISGGDTAVDLEQQFRTANAAAGAATGRQMALTNVSRDYAVDSDQGRLILSFTWTEFARVNGSQLIVRDSFYTANGTWLETLPTNQSLVVSPPSGYALTNSPPNSYLDNRDLRIDGEETFTRGELHIEYEGAAAGPPARTGTPGTTTPGPNTGQVPIWSGLSVLLIVAVVAAIIYLNDPDGFPAIGAGGTDSGDGPSADPAAADGESDDDIDVALLSDEERVERLLEENGGRMKQARIVKETGWSNAKVSQLLSAMDEDGRIDKLRIGRENLISFPDEDVTEIED